MEARQRIHSPNSDGCDDDHLRGPSSAEQKEPSFTSNEKKALLRTRRRGQGNEDVDFNMVVLVAKKTGLSIDEVHDKMKDFMYCDQGGNGSLSLQEFEAAVRVICNVRPDEDVPKHLLQSSMRTCDADADGQVSFEEYVVWSMEVAYAEEVLVPNAGERILRNLAREHGFRITDVEKVKVIFDEFDIDGSGNIENEEFFNVIMKLMNVKNPSDVSKKRLQRYWAEVDTDRSGEVTFEEFFLWYTRIGGGAGLCGTA